MTLYQPHKFVIFGILVFWALIFAVLIGYKEFTLRTGTEILVQTVPVDPRDIFRGDYVILRYPFSTIEITREDQLQYQVGESVYVSLQKREKYWELYNISRQFEIDDEKIKNLPGADVIYLKGTIDRISTDTITVTYDIESYFVPEGKGKEIERAIQSGDVSVVLKVDRFGHAAIKNLQY